MLFSLALYSTLASALDDGSAAFYERMRVTDNPDATVVRVNLTKAYEENGARCLDGSVPIFYYRKGTGAGATKWYIHHQGGGWCESWDDCLSRSGGSLGSTLKDPPVEQMSSGYDSVDPAVNPMMYNWNFVFLRYCDGASFSGNNDTVAEYEGKKLYFRGNRNRQGAVDLLLSEYGLDQATDVVVSGCSAGGLATYLHADQWCDSVAAKSAGVKCVALPDSGFFLDYEAPTSGKEGLLGQTTPGNYHNGLQWSYTVQNATAGVNQGCIAAKDPADQYLCMFAEHTSDYIKTPLFAMQSQYDTWQAGHVLGQNTPELNTELGKNITSRYMANVLAKNPKSGAFLDSCSHHCGAWNNIIINGDNIATAFMKWYYGYTSQKLWNQDQAYPCKECCQVPSA